MENKFITYIRTCQFRQCRFRDGNALDSVFISRDEIKKRFFPSPEYDVKKELEYLVQINELYIEQKVLNNGNKAYFYKALKTGGIDFSLIKTNGSELNETHKAMMSYLKDVSLSENAPSTLYFDVFLSLKEQYLRMFFTVDQFSNRVHTPVTNFHRTHRPNILLQGEKTTSLDVATMQPLLLGKILKDELGENEYSNWISSGNDIYIMIQEKAKLKNRDEAKKLFFKILFAPANNKLAEMFGASNWINWINEFKSKPLLSNPHTIEKEYSNLAWLLQTTEVKVMYKVWHNLINNNILFLSVHDEIIIRERDLIEAEIIFKTVLDYEFEYYKLNNKSIINTKSKSEQPQTENEIIFNNCVEFFNITDIANKTIKLNDYTTITDVKTFVNDSIILCKNNVNSKVYLPYLERLNDLYKILSISSN